LKNFAHFRFFIAKISGFCFGILGLF